MNIKAGDPVLVKGDYMVELWDEGPLTTFVLLVAGSEGTIDHFGPDDDVCISFYDQYFVIGELDDFNYDGVFMVNYTKKQQDLLLQESSQPLLQLIKKEQ